MLKENEKLLAFMALGAGVLALALLAFFNELPENSANMRIIDAALGGLLLAFGAATNALFRIREADERSVTIDNPPSNPVPTEEANPSATGELPEEQKI